MREMLYRGRKLDKEEWLEGSLLVYPDGDCFICCPEGKPYELIKYEVAPFTVGQYIGKEDEHGKKIFEGDIVYTYDNLYGYEFEGVVVYQNASFTIQSKDKMTHHRWMDYEVEVIGNVHDGKGRDNG